MDKNVTNDDCLGFFEDEKKECFDDIFIGY